MRRRALLLVAGLGGCDAAVPTATPEAPPETAHWMADVFAADTAVGAMLSCPSL